METTNSKVDTELSALSSDQMLRLQRLAELANERPEDVWLEVRRYGWDDVEDGILADLEGLEYFKNNPGIPHADVMADAWRIVAACAKRQSGGG